MEFASFLNVDIIRPKKTVNFKTKANLQQPQRKPQQQQHQAKATAAATATAASANSVALLSSAVYRPSSGPIGLNIQLTSAVYQPSSRPIGLNIQLTIFSSMIQFPSSLQQRQQRQILRPPQQFYSKQIREN
jgi:hypothetical protein